MLINLKLMASGPFAPAALLLGLLVVTPHVVSLQERHFAAPEFRRVPYQMGAWRAAGDQQLDAGVTEYLKPDEYILRDYSNASAGTSVNLFLAYFRTLQNAWGPHSPRICLPGSGWLIQSSVQTSIAVPGPVAKIPVNQFVMEKSGQHILVIYWYQNNRRIWAEEYLSKFRLIEDLVKYQRSDVSLIRLITPLKSGVPEDELNQCLDFAKTVYPILSDRFTATN